MEHIIVTNNTLSYYDKKLKSYIGANKPVKGVDYFTEADKKELVEAVIEAVPSAEGVSF